MARGRIWKVQFEEGFRVFPVQLSCPGTNSKLPGLVPANAGVVKVPDTKLPMFCNVNVTADPGEDPPVMSILELVAGVKLKTGANPDAVPDKAGLFEVTPLSPTDTDAE